jgi:hypothetical protein
MKENQLSAIMVVVGVLRIELEQVPVKLGNSIFGIWGKLPANK